MSILKTLFIFISIVFASLVIANTKAVSESPKVVGSTLTLNSQYLEESPSFDVYLPSDYGDTSNKVTYPVIYTLDGWLLSESTHGVVKLLSDSAEIPKAIVVSVRSSPFLAWADNLHIHETKWGVGRSDSTLRDDYISYFEKELIPFIDKRYRTNEFKILATLSPSAIFGMHSFLKAPNLFDAHFLFAAIDVLGLGYKEGTNFIDEIESHLTLNPKRKGYLYIASAAYETESQPEQIAYKNRLKQVIQDKGNADLKFKIEHIEGLGHYPMVINGLTSALGLIFPNEDIVGLRFLLEKEGNALEHLLNYYGEWSKKVGFTMYPNFNLTRNSNCVRYLAIRLRSEGRLVEAEQMFNYWIEHTPNSVQAIAGLARTQHILGNLKEAKVLYYRAFELAKTSNSFFVSLIEQRIKEIEASEK